MTLPRRVWLRSALLARHTGHRPWAPRLVAGWRTRIERAPDAVVDLHGPLWLGYWPSGPPAKGETVLQLGQGATFRTEGWAIVGPGTHVIVGPGASLVLGAGTTISVGARILCYTSVRLGAGTNISWDTTVMDTDHHAVRIGDEIRPHSAPIVLENDVLVGAGARILKGVTVGAGAVVGAGALVTRDVPPSSLVAGVPAKVVHDEVEWW